MATHAGSEGTVKSGANAIAEIRSFSLEEIQRYFQKMKAEKRNARVECVEVIMEYDDDTEYEYVA